MLLNLNARVCIPSENQAVNNDPDRFDFSKDDAYSEMSVQYVPKNTKKKMIGPSITFKRGWRPVIEHFPMPNVRLIFSSHRGTSRRWRTGFRGLRARQGMCLVAGIPHRVYFPFCPGYFVAVVPLTLTVPTFWMQNKRNSAKCTPSWTPIFENCAKTASELR